MDPTIETLQRRAHERCAVCHGALERDQVEDVEVTGCPLCDTALHADCAAVVGRCPTMGCPVELVPVAPEPSFAEQMEARDGELVRQWAWIGAGVGLCVGAALGNFVLGLMQGALLGPVAGLFLRALTTGTPELKADRERPML